MSRNEDPVHQRYSSSNGDTHSVQDNKSDDYDTEYHYPAPQTSHKYNNPRPCKSHAQCYRPDCKFEHPEGWSACYDGVQCINYDCNANHPPGRRFPCRFGNRCNWDDCHFLHPKIKNNQFSQEGKNYQTSNFAKALPTNQSLKHM